MEGWRLQTAAPIVSNQIEFYRALYPAPIPVQFPSLSPLANRGPAQAGSREALGQPRGPERWRILVTVREKSLKWVTEDDGLFLKLQRTILKHQPFSLLSAFVSALSSS